MGFNIGVHSAQAKAHTNCAHFIDRMLYNYVNSGEQYGDASILIQSGRYYGLDLSPLLKLVYTWDEVTPDYIRENVQSLNSLLGLVRGLRNAIAQDPSVCDGIHYVWYEQPVTMTEQERAAFIREAGDFGLPYLEQMDRRKKEIEENPNPWRWYFAEGRILKDLDDLLEWLQCYEKEGVAEVYLTAG